MKNLGKEQKIKKLKESIKRHAPVVAEFFDNKDTIGEYSEKLYRFTADEIYLQRQQALSEEMRKFIKRLFSAEVEIESPLVVNIVDHHSIISHPILVATNIVANAFRLLKHNKNPIVVLTSSVVPPNNFFNKKGFQFNNFRIPLFSNSEMHQAGCFIDIHDFHFIDRLKSIERWNELSQIEQKFLVDIEREILGLDYSKAKNYNDQIGIINSFLWKKLFHQNIRTKIPDLYYLPQEDITRELLPSILREENIISRSIFDSDFRAVVLKKFDGLTGCWDEQSKKGTHFFWFRNEKNEAERLFLVDNQLVSEDKLKIINLDKDEIIDLVKKKEIIPNLFIIFGYVTYWCGLKPLVGYGSCNYLTRMKEAWLEALKGYDNEEHKRISGIDTKGLIGGVIVTFGRDSKNEIAANYAFDVIARGGLTEDYLNNLFSMKFKDILNPALLEIYESYVPVQERVDLGLKPMDMMGKAYSWVK